MHGFAVPTPAMTIRHEEDAPLVVGLRIDYRDRSEIPAMLATLERRIFIEYGRDLGSADVPGLMLLGIVMPCGRRYLFHTKDDIPTESMPCDCGKEGHWVVLFERIGKVVKLPATWP